MKSVTEETQIFSKSFSE